MGGGEFMLIFFFVGLVPMGLKDMETLLLDVRLTEPTVAGEERCMNYILPRMTPEPSQRICGVDLLLCWFFGTVASAER